jgi:hypothetical protein
LLSNFQYGLPAASSGKTNTAKLFSSHDYMPVICGFFGKAWRMEDIAREF